jgi:hypothetical protein
MFYERRQGPADARVTFIVESMRNSELMGKIS